MKVRVIHEFKDKEADLELRKEGTVLEVSEARGKYLTDMKVVKIIEEKGEKK